jgi:hypothetical protein
MHVLHRFRCLAFHRYGVWEEITYGDVGVAPTSVVYAGQFREGRLHGNVARMESLGHRTFR